MAYNSISINPICICLAYMYMFARFDENPAMTLQDIKKQNITNGRTHTLTDGQHETEYPPHFFLPGRIATDPGVTSSIPARSHTFVKIDHEIISTVILLPSADSFKKGCCQLQAKVCAQITA